MPKFYKLHLSVVILIHSISELLSLASVQPGSFQNSSDSVMFISPGNIAKYKLLCPFSYLSAFQMPGKSTNQRTNLCHLLGVIYHHQKK